MDALSAHKFALSFSLDQSFGVSLSKPPNLILKAQLLSKPSSLF
jgi:hypothetical protein